MTNIDEAIRDVCKVSVTAAPKSVVRKIFTEFARSERLRTLKEVREEVEKRKDDGCLRPYEHGKDCTIWCRNIDATIRVIDKLLEKDKKDI